MLACCSFPSLRSSIICGGPSLAEAKTICRPSGDQAGEARRPGAKVRRRVYCPSAFMTGIWLSSLSCRTTAICRPSGDQTGIVHLSELPSASVSLRRPLPSALITKIWGIPRSQEDESPLTYLAKCFRPKSTGCGLDRNQARSP